MMTRLSDTQLLILNAAAKRDDGNVLPLPGSLRGGAAIKVVDALISRGLITECTSDSVTKPDAALNRVWRNDGEGRAVLLRITHAGLAAIGVVPEGTQESSDSAGEGDADAPKPDAATKAATEAVSAPAARIPREGTKQAKLIAMLRSPEGATIAEIVVATGWQPHTVRGAIAGALKKKLGLAVTSEKVDGRGRVYRLP